MAAPVTIGNVVFGDGRLAEEADDMVEFARKREQKSVPAAESTCNGEIIVACCLRPQRMCSLLDGEGFAPSRIPD
jgi:hypothetical protein